jgi:hypothetical protein
MTPLHLDYKDKQRRQHNRILMNATVNEKGSSKLSASGLE